MADLVLRLNRMSKKCLPVEENINKLMIRLLWFDLQDEVNENKR